MSTYSRQSHANPDRSQHSVRVNATEQGLLTIMEENNQLNQANKVISKDETVINTFPCIENRTSTAFSVSVDGIYPAFEQLPDSIAAFFGTVSPTGFPRPEKIQKKQPWRAALKGLQGPSKDGTLVVACPKRCLYGSTNLGGY